MPKSLWLVCANKQFEKCPNMCYVIFYIVDVLGSFIGYKPDNGNNNKDAKG
jgi:hypothetical protein